MLLSVKNLKKHFPVFSGVFRRQTGCVKAVDDVSFDIRKGQAVGLVGESGSGKSTTAKTAMRLEEPSSGEVYFEGEDFLNASPAKIKSMRRHMQMIFQDPYSSLNPRKTIEQSLSEGIRYHNVCNDEKEIRKVLYDCIEKVGLLPEQLSHYPHEFSGGQQQRICIARAIAVQPKLIVCDEAVSALDVSIQAQILNLLKDLQKDLNLSYLFISHDLSVVRYFCDEIHVMTKGKIVESASSKDLFANPRHPYTKALLASIPIDHPSQRRISC